MKAGLVGVGTLHSEADRAHQLARAAHTGTQRARPPALRLANKRYRVLLLVLIDPWGVLNMSVGAAGGDRVGWDQHGSRRG